MLTSDDFSTELAGHEHILDRIQTARGLRTMGELPVPARCVSEVSVLGRDAIASGTLVGGDGATLFVGLDRDIPAAAGEGVIVAVSAEWSQSDRDRCGRFEHRQAADTRISTLHHPQTLLEPQISDGPGPHWQLPLEGERVEMDIALRRDGAVGIFVAAERVALTAIFDLSLAFRDQYATFYRWLEGRHQPTVIASRAGAGDRAAGVTTDTIGHQPFALGSLGEIREVFAGEGDAGRAHRAVLVVAPGISTAMRYRRSCAVR